VFKNAKGAGALESLPELLTINQVSERWGVRPGTVRDWIAGGAIPGTTEPLPHMRVGGRWIRFRPQDVEYIESRMIRVVTKPKRTRSPRSGTACPS
jgi:hypothetical protein